MWPAPLTIRTFVLFQIASLSLFLCSRPVFAQKRSLTSVSDLELTGGVNGCTFPGGNQTIDLSQETSVLGALQSLVSKDVRHLLHPTRGASISKKLVDVSNGIEKLLVSSINDIDPCKYYNSRKHFMHFSMHSLIIMQVKIARLAGHIGKVHRCAVWDTEYASEARYCTATL